MSQYHMAEHLGLTLDLLRFTIERQLWQPCILCYIACFSPGCRLSMDIAKYCTAMPGLLQHGMHPALKLVQLPEPIFKCKRKLSLGLKAHCVAHLQRLYHVCHTSSAAGEADHFRPPNQVVVSHSDCLLLYDMLLLLQARLGPAVFCSQ